MTVANSPLSAGAALAATLLPIGAATQGSTSTETGEFEVDLSSGPSTSASTPLIGMSKHPARATCWGCGGKRFVGRLGMRACESCNATGEVCAWCESPLSEKSSDGLCAECWSVDGERAEFPNKQAQRDFIDAEVSL